MTIKRFYGWKLKLRAITFRTFSIKRIVFGPDESRNIKKQFPSGNLTRQRRVFTMTASRVKRKFSQPSTIFGQK